MTTLRAITKSFERTSALTKSFTATFANLERSLNATRLHFEPPGLSSRLALRFPALGDNLLERVDERFRGLLAGLDFRSPLVEEIATAVTERLGDQGAKTEVLISPESFVFRKRGTQWEVRFDGEEGFFSDLKGFATIARLLQVAGPQVLLPATMLLGLAGDVTKSDRSSQPVLDHEALKALSQELSEYEAEIDQDARQGDTTQAEVLRHERDETRSHLFSAEGHLGRCRELGPPTNDERARQTVRQQIKRAIAKIGEADPPMRRLVEHLQSSLRGEGSGYAYRPVRALSWQLD